jgi:hypothetical protein
MVIVVGSKMDYQMMAWEKLTYDFESAKRLLRSINKIKEEQEDYSDIIRKDKDQDISKEDNHLILLGGTAVNEITLLLVPGCPCNTFRSMEKINFIQGKLSRN